MQQEAFRKLIKKYRKWTGSSELGYRFQDEVRQRESSFTNTDLKPFLDRYEELLHTVRSLYQQSQTRTESQVKTPSRAWPDRSTPPSSRLALVNPILDSGKRVDFDHLLATLKFGDDGKNAVFWVHPENVVELQVLLSQYTRSFNASCRQPSASSTASGQSSPNLSQSTSMHTDTFDIVADEPKRFLAQLGSETVSSVEVRPDKTLQKAALHARGTTKDDVAMLAWKQDGNQQTPLVESCPMKRKFVDAMVDRKGRMPAQKAAIQHTSFESPASTSAESVERLQKWLQSHRDVHPITTILSQRARFFNGASNASGVLLAALDQNIHFQPGAAPGPDSSNSAKFPHAVLRVRQEGSQIVDLIQILNKSHLVCGISKIWST